MAYTDYGEWDTSTIWGRWSFSVCNEMLNRGVTKTLEFDDLMQIPTTDQSTKLMRILKMHYRNSTAFWFIPRLFVAMLKAAGMQNILAVTFFMVLESVFRVALPIALIYLLTALQTGTTSECYIWAGVMSFLGFGLIVSHHVGFLFSYRVGWNWKTACTALIHDRLFYLDGGTLQASNTGTGMMVNLISNDVQRFEEFGVVCCFLSSSL